LKIANLSAFMNLRRNPFSHHHKIFRLSAVLIFLAMLSAVFSGCSMLHVSRSQPGAQISSIQLTNHPAGPISIGALQQQIMRFADTYVATLAQACDEISATTTNSNLHLQAMRWKLNQASAAYNDAIGQNPTVNALDMLVLVTLSRMVAEDYGVKTFGNEIMPLVDAQRKLETNAWQLADRMLRPAQQQELRNLILEWRTNNPNQHYVGSIRFSEFISSQGQTRTSASSAPTSIFSLLYLDPLAGLDPTAAAIEQTRELGERLMYYSQRMPGLLSWQAEVLAYQLANQPESQQVLGDANRLATSAEIFASTAQQLPKLVNDQRQAAIQQVFDNLAAQGEKSRELLLDARSTLNAAGVAATNIDNAIQSLTAFVQYVSPTNEAPSSATNSKPFNVLDYGTAAAQIGAAATNLTTLLASVNGSLPQLQKLSEQTTANANRVVEHAFRLGLILILVLLGGCVLAGLIYRILANRLARGNQKSSRL
jgi:hypothetical protein